MRPRKSGESSRSSRPWFSNGNSGRRTSFRTVEEEEQPKSLFRLFSYGLNRRKALNQTESERRGISFDLRRASHCLKRKGTSNHQPKPGWGSTSACTASIPSERTPDNDDSPQKPCTKRAAVENRMDDMKSSQITPQIHETFCAALTASIEISPSRLSSSSHTFVRTGPLDDRIESFAATDASNKRRISSAWARTKMRRSGSTTGRFTQLAGRRDSRDGAGSVVSSAAGDADSCADVPGPPSAFETPVRASKMELRRSLDMMAQENLQLRETISKLVMDDVEVAALKNRVTDLEWALDVVTDDAKRIREEAFEALSQSQRFCVSANVSQDANLELWPCDDYATGEEDQWEIRCSSRRGVMHENEMGTSTWNSILELGYSYWGNSYWDILGKLERLVEGLVAMQ